MTLTGVGRAGTAQDDLYDSLNVSERRSVDQALEALGLVRDEAPSGKRFGALHLRNLPVFVGEMDGLMWLNHLHATTLAHVIEQEILWRCGDPYDPEPVWETVRNLRARNTLSVVAIVPVLSADPEQVDMLAVTRDIWSLRLGFRLEMTDRVIDELQVSLTEWNVAGRHKQIALSAIYRQDTLSIGPTYVDPRLFGTRIYLLEAFRLVVNHQTGELEGSTNLAEIGLPMYRRSRRWGFEVVEQHDIGIDRFFRGSALRTYDNPDTEVEETVPIEIDQQEADVYAAGVVRLGDIDKHRFSLGYGLSVRRYSLFDLSWDEATREAFRRDILPRGELASYLSFGYRFYHTGYTSVTDYQTYGFSEDLRLGHDLELAVDLGLVALGSDTNFIRPSLLAGYLAASHGFVIDSQVEIGGRWELRSSELIDRYVRAALHLASPTWGPVRVHAGGTGLVRMSRVFAGIESVGGPQGLRGFPTGAFIGESQILGHVEIRTAPLELLTVFWGLVAFFDAGSVFDEGEDIELLTDVGLGIRAVIPQLQRIPWRVDYAFPLTGPYSVLPGVLTVGTEQVF